MNQVFVTFSVIFFQIICNCNSQRTNYGERCNSTEECSDHRYECRETGEENILRCLCDRYHTWMGEYVGCVQIYNTSDMVNMTKNLTIITSIMSVTEENVGDFDKEVNRIMRMQIVAGLFVFGMIIIGFLAVSVFCIYIRRKDFSLSRSVKAEVKAMKAEKEEKRKKAAAFQPASTSARIV